MSGTDCNKWLLLLTTVITLVPEIQEGRGGAMHSDLTSTANPHRRADL